MIHALAQPWSHNSHYVTLVVKAIRAAVQAYKTDDSALAPFSFDKNGDTTMMMMSGNTVKNGKFEFMAKLGSE